MARISAGISQIGGKFRLVNTILEYIPYHEFYLEPFLGAGWVLLNKPRCRYECGNDLNAEIINYMLTIAGRVDPETDIILANKLGIFNNEATTFDKKKILEFEAMKQGVFGLVSQEICNRIVRGELVPRNNIERAYFFYYLNKLTFGGGVWMVRKNPPYQGIDPTNQAGKFDKQYDCTLGGSVSRRASGGGRIGKEEIKKAKQDYEYKTKGYTGIGNPRVLPTLHQEDFDKAKEKYKKEASNYRGIHKLGGCNFEKGKERYKQAQIKGINPKTTRPYTNNDCGLLSPLDSNCIKRLRYVNLTCYPFDKVYKMFYEAFHVRKDLGPECFLYIDRPYPGTEKYYKSGFAQEEHKILNNIVLESPFHILESLGGDCEWIIDEYREAGLIIKEISTKYSTDANSQKDSREYLIMNYDINELPVMQYSSEQNTIEGWLS